VNPDSAWGRDIEKKVRDFERDIYNLKMEIKDIGVSAIRDQIKQLFSGMEAKAAQIDLKKN